MRTTTTTTLFVFLSLAVTITHTLADEWAAGADPCGDGGQCHTMLSSYESLIQGDGCRPFFTTGLCPRLCAFSLKSLIGRHTWARCVKRCEWPDHVIHAADSWLSMCLSRQEPAKPSDKQLQQEEHKTVDGASTGGDGGAHTEDKGDDKKEDLKHWSRRVFHHHQLHKPKVDKSGRTIRFRVLVVLSGLIVVALLALIVTSARLQTPPVIVAKKALASVRIYARHYTAKLTDSARRLLPGKKANRRSRGVLDGPADFKSASKTSSSSNPLLQRGSSLHRGARKHLKAMRSNLD